MLVTVGKFTKIKYYTAKNDQVVAILMKTGLDNVLLPTFFTIDNSHYRLILKLDKEMQINHHSKKEHTKISKIAKFGCEML